MRASTTGALLLLGLHLALLTPLAAQSPEESERLAVAAAEAWLTHIDAGRFEESWSEAAPDFRAAVTPQQWEAAGRQVRSQTGPLLSRTLASATYRTSLPNVPPGEFVVIEYQSTFQNAASAVETVIMRKEGDAVWRGVGYFVRPG